MTCCDMQLCWHALVTLAALRPLPPPPPSRWYYAGPTLISNPTYTCFFATNSGAYSNFIGNASNLTHVLSGSGTYYNLTAPIWNAWANFYPCTQELAAICELPVAAYACAGYPPPSPPLSPLSDGPGCK